MSLRLLAVDQADYAAKLGFGPLSPDRYGLPGGNTALALTGGITFYSLLLVIVGLVLSAGLWAVGAFSNSHNQTINGKKGFLVCAACALVIGAAFLLVQWFYDAGQTVR